MAIVLNTKTYNWSGWVNGVSSWIERSLGLAALFSSVTASLRIDSMAREQWKLTVPFPPVPAEGCCATETVLGFAEATINIRMSPSLTTANRTDFRERLEDLIQSAEFTAAVVNLVTPTA